MTPLLRQLSEWTYRLAQLFRKNDSSASSRLAASKIHFKKLSEVLDYRIINKFLFAEALTHRSFFQNSESDDVESYERLEFLGDAVLGVVAAQYLYERFTNAPEGALTKMRSRLVSGKSLCVCAKRLHLDEFLLHNLKPGNGDNKGLDTILADSYEAVIAAIYLDGGYSEAKRFIERELETAMQHGVISVEDENFKSQLLEFSQAGGLGMPRYEVIREDGPDHDRTFTIEVFINNETYGVGTGKSKKDAEQSAAELALQKLRVV